MMDLNEIQTNIEEMVTLRTKILAWVSLAYLGVVEIVRNDLTMILVVGASGNG
jgi:hypothetical protein